MLRPFLFPGRDLLSRDAYGHSTIGAGGLNCRVRDGNGCYTSAMTTGNHLAGRFEHLYHFAREALFFDNRMRVFQKAFES